MKVMDQRKSTATSACHTSSKTLQSDMRTSWSNQFRRNRDAIRAIGQALSVLSAIEEIRGGKINEIKIVLTSTKRTKFIETAAANCEHVMGSR